MNFSLIDSVFATRKELLSLAQRGILGDAVLKILLPESGPLLYEKSMWDYKLSLPKSPTVKPNQILLNEYNAGMAEIVKDAVSFYNSYGGYIVVGVKDRPRDLAGYSEQFDVDDLNKRIKGATGHDIDCHFSIFSVTHKGKQFPIGLLFIPQRPDSALPAQFRKDAPENPRGAKAYSKGDYYFRQGDQCKPATEPEEISFLCAPGRRIFSDAHNFRATKMLDNNLGPKDPDLIKFVGREDHLRRLWHWILEKFSPCKLLSGFGGVGKTTIAREFAEAVANEAPLGFERVIWLSAKPRYWRSFKGTIQPADPDDIRFFDARSLLSNLLWELAITNQDVDIDADIPELIEVAVSALSTIPSFVVIDDLDSLEDTEQQTVFQLTNQIFGQTINKGIAASKALLTARLDIGAAPSQVLKVKGLEYSEFMEYIETVSNELQIDRNFLKNTSLIEKFYKITDGSPIFANSILRLVAYGEKLDVAIEHWRGTDGEEVRRFTFEREISFLSDSELRTLLALCELKQTSLVELEHVLEINRGRLRDNLVSLRKYHLIVREEEAPAGGPDIAIPNTIKLMQPVLESHVRDPQNIKRRCKEARAGTSSKKLEVSYVISRVVNLWRSGDIGAALEVAEWAHKRDRKQPDLCCLYGRALLRMDDGRDPIRKADAAFREAYQNNCKRPELFPHWLEAKKALGDWQGIIEVSRLSDRGNPTADNVLIRALAFKELGDEAKSRGNLRTAAEHLAKAAEEVELAFRRGQAKGRVDALLDLKTAALREYVSINDIFNSDKNDYIFTWQACCKAFDLHLRSPDILFFGLDRLKEWWGAVEIRERYDQKAGETLKVQISKLNSIAEELFRKQMQHEDIYLTILNVRDYLEQRGDSYLSHE